MNIYCYSQCVDILPIANMTGDDCIPHITLYGPRKQPKQNQQKTEAYILRSIDDEDNWEFIYLTPKGAEFEMNETSVFSTII